MEVDALLSALMQRRWQRLSCEYNDPLGMLFNNKALQWTLGWAPGGTSLYLLVWESSAWDQKALWRLYENGRLCYEAEDGLSRERSALCHKLLESKELPVIEPYHLLERLTGYQYDAVEREWASRNLEASLQARPELIDVLKPALFAYLENTLHEDDVPLLEILKVHRLGHKNNLLRLFPALNNLGQWSQADQSRLNDILRRLYEQYQALNQTVSPLFYTHLHAAYEQLRQIVALQAQAMFAVTP